MGFRARPARHLSWPSAKTSGAMFLAIPISVATLLCAACGTNTGWMPLEQGRTWTYYVQTPAINRVESLRCERAVRVGLARGWSITSEAGSSKLAWSGSNLIASELLGTTFDPPLKLLDASSTHAKWKYSGLCQWGMATAKISVSAWQAPDNLRAGGQDRSSILVTHQFSLDGKHHELKTWYQMGTGVIRQEHRINRRRVVALEWIGGK